MTSQYIITMIMLLGEESPVSPPCMDMPSFGATKKQRYEAVNSQDRIKQRQITFDLPSQVYTSVTFTQRNTYDTPLGTPLTLSQIDSSVPGKQIYNNPTLSPSRHHYVNSQSNITQTPQDFVSVIGKACLDMPVVPVNRIRQDWISQTSQDFVSVIGVQKYELPPRGYSRFTQDYILQFQSYVLTSADPPCGKQLYDLPPKGPLDYSFAIESQIEIVQYGFYTNALTRNHGVQSYELPPRGYIRPVQDHVNQTPQGFVSVIGKSCLEIPVIPVKRFTQDHVNQTPQNFVSVIGKQSYDIPPTGYKRPSKDWINQTPQDFVSLPEGSSVYDLAPRGYVHFTKDFYINVQNFVLTSSGIPEGKQIYDVLGYDIQRSNRSRIAVRSQDEQLQVQNFVLTSAAIPDGKIIYDLPIYGLKSRTYLEITFQPIYTLQLTVLPEGIQSYQLAPRGYSKPVQDWITQTSQDFVSLPEGSRVYDLAPRGYSRPVSDHINQTPQDFVSVPNGIQITELPPRGYRRFTQDHVSQTPQDFVSVIGSQVYALPVIGINRQQPQLLPVLDFVLTSAAQPEGEQLYDVLGYDLNRAYRNAIVAISTNILGAPIAVLSTVVTNLSVGVQLTDLLGYDVARIYRQNIAVRSQSEQLQVQNFVLTSADQPEGEQSYELPPRGYTRPVQDHINQTSQDFVSLPEGARIYELAPRSYPRPLNGHINQTSQDFVSLPNGSQYTEVPPRGRKGFTSDHINQTSQDFVSVVGQSTLALPVVRITSRPWLDIQNTSTIIQVTDAPCGVQVNFVPSRVLHRQIGIVIPNTTTTAPLPLNIPEGVQWYAFRKIRETRFQTDIFCVKSFVLISATQPDGEQLTTAELPGRNILDDKRRKIAIGSMDVIGTPLVAISTINLPVGEQLTSLLGYDTIRLAKRRAAVQSQIEILQVQKFVLTSAAPPDGKSVYDLPIIYPTRIQAIRSQAQISQTPQEFVSTVGKQVYVLPVLRVRRAIQPELVPVFEYRLNEPAIQSTFVLPRVRPLARPHLEVQFTPSYTLQLGVLLPGQQTYAMPVLPKSRFVAVNSQNFINTTPQDFVSIIGKQAIEPRRRPILRAIQPELVPVFEYRLNEPQVQSVCALPLPRTRSKAYLEFPVQPIINLSLSTFPVGHSTYDMPKRNVKRTQQAEQVSVLDYRLNEPIIRQSISQQVRREKSRVYLDQQFVPNYMLQLVIDVPGVQLCLVPNREISRRHAINSHINTTRLESYTVGKQIYTLPTIRVRRAIQPELVSVLEYRLNEPAVQSTYNLPLARPLARPHIEVQFIPNYTLQLGIMPIGKQIHAMPVYGIKSRTNGFTTSSLQEFVSVIGEQSIEPRRRPILRAIQPELISVLEYRLNEPKVQSTFVVPLARSKSKTYLEFPVQPLTTLHLATLPAGRSLYDLPPRGAKRAQQPEQVVVLDYRLNEPLIVQNISQQVYRVKSRAYLEQQFVPNNTLQLTTELPGIQLCLVPNRGISRKSAIESHISSIPQSFVSVIGKQHTAVINRNTRRVLEYIAVRPNAILDTLIAGSQVYDLPIRRIPQRDSYVHGSRGFLLTSADQPNGKQLITDILPGSDVKSSRQRRIALMSMDVRGTSINILSQTVITLVVGNQITDLLGHDIIRARKYRIAIESQSEILQVQGFVLLSATVPPGTQSTTLPVYRFGYPRRLPTIYATFGIPLTTRIKKLVPPLKAIITFNGRTTATITNTNGTTATIDADSFNTCGEDTANAIITNDGITASVLTNNGETEANITYDGNTQAIMPED